MNVQEMGCSAATRAEEWSRVSVALHYRLASLCKLVTASSPATDRLITVMDTGDRNRPMWLAMVTEQVATEGVDKRSLPQCPPYLALIMNTEGRIESTYVPADLKGEELWETFDPAALDDPEVVDRLATAFIERVRRQH